METMTVESAEEIARQIFRLVAQAESLSHALERGNMDVLEELASTCHKVSEKAKELYEFTHQ